MRIALTLAAFVLSLPVLAQDAQFRASVDVVRIEALVLERGHPVAGLTAADFVVTDDGVPQTIAVRPLAREPIDVAIALDVSSSVRGNRLELLRGGVRALVTLLTPADRATLLTFDHAVALGPRDVEPAAIEARLRAITAQGWTSLFDAATAAIVWSAGRQRPMLILVFSDGGDTVSWTRSEQVLALSRRADAVVDAVVTGGFSPMGVRLNARRMESARRVWETPDELLLEDLAFQTGGRVRDVESGRRLTEAFRESLEQFRARYEITYSAGNQKAGWHEVEVRVPRRTQAVVHARRGYHR
jgi:VWFA-related protein